MALQYVNQIHLHQGRAQVQTSTGLTPMEVAAPSSKPSAPSKMVCAMSDISQGSACGCHFMDSITCPSTTMNLPADSLSCQNTLMLSGRQLCSVVHDDLIIHCYLWGMPKSACRWDRVLKSWLQFANLTLISCAAVLYDQTSLAACLL